MVCNTIRRKSAIDGQEVLVRGAICASLYEQMGGTVVYAVKRIRRSNRLVGLGLRKRWGLLRPDSDEIGTISSQNVLGAQRERALDCLLIQETAV